MRTFSFASHSTSDIREQLHSLEKKDFNYELAFVFATPRSDIKQVSKIFSDCKTPVVGCSTGGNILVDEGDKVIYEDMPVITLLEIDSKHFSYLCLEREDRSSYDFGEEIGKWGHNEFSKPNFIVIACGLSLNGEEFVNGIVAAAGKDTVLFGGLAGDETKFEQNYVFSREKLIESGAIAIAFDSEHIDMSGIATSGWVGLGKDLTVTSSESNIVYSIDHEPALNVYKKYLNVKDSDLPAVGVEYPLLIKRDDGSSALRAVMGVDKEMKSLLFAGSVPENATVSFSSSPGFEVIDRTCEKIDEFYNKHPEADVLLLFSCMARHLALGPMISEEISFPARKWGLPVAGFFTYGEFGTNTGSSSGFFNQTYTLVILKEK
ncbi:MAG: FIST N-terminal domain-containing protein [Bacteroidales bacterium]|jgi:hypothetical protein|nr:FIST N-terminal domain-containing protein [Bacteroidales bacterium]